MKKILSFMLVIVLLFSSLSACKSKKAVEDKSAESSTTVAITSKESSDDKALEGVSFDLEETGRIDKLIASFGKEEPIKPYEMNDTLDGKKYSVPDLPINIFSNDLCVDKIEYERNAVVTETFLNKTQSKENIDLYGESWDFSVYACEGKSEDILERVLKAYEVYLRKNGAKDVGIVEKNVLFVSLDDLFVHIDLIDSLLTVRIVRENQLKVNTPITIKPSDYEDNEVSYVFDLPEGEYVHAELKIDKGAVNRIVRQHRLSGSFEYTLKEEILYDEDEGLEFVNYDFAYMPGRTVVNFYWYDENEPGEIKFAVKTDGKINNIKFAEPLGAIRLKSELVDAINIDPVLRDSVSISHPQVNIDEIHFDRTPKNGYLAYLPAGLYNLEIGTKTVSASGYNTVRVPVSSGRVTDVIVPENFTDSIMDETIGGIKQGIDIQSIEEKSGEKDTVRVVFTILDDELKDIEASKENMSAFESGISGEVTDVRLVPTPPEIILLLDSSGSMKGEMSATIKAAKEFINRLDKDAKVEVVDFDTKVKPINAKSREGLLAALDKVRAEGATALDDSIAYALDKLGVSERPIIVAFTDGEDAIRDGVRGSKISRQALIDKINESKVPIYTIGFGAEHDSTSLELFSKLSNGYYFPAKNQNALEAVFKAINEKIGSTYELTYKRPKKIGKSNVPVLTFVVDVSGSMNNAGSEFPRVLDDVKRIYSEVVMGLADDIKLQLITFNTDIYVVQGITQDKRQFLSALGQTIACYGTNIEDSIKIGYKTTDAVPAKKKAFIYLTDAALEVDEEYESETNKIYSKIKDKNINSLWIGLGIEDEEPFKAAAQKTGGDYVISGDPEEIKRKIEKALENINVDDNQVPVVSIEIEKKAEDGTYKKYSSTKLSELPALPTSDGVAIIDGIRYAYAENIDTLSPEMIKLIHGNEYAGEERATNIDKRMKVDSEANSEAMKIKASEMVFMNKLLGVEAPDGMKFAAIKMNLQNILPEQEVVVYEDGSGHPANWLTSSDQGKVVKAKVPYLIPDYTSHFALAYNNEGPYPASMATSLTAKPIIAPGEIGVEIAPDSSREGMMVFLVPDVPMKQSALYYYDDKYGYITLPVVGKAEMIKGEFSVASAAKMKMGELFELELKDQIFESEEVDKETYNYQTLTLNLISKIQGKLNINLQELTYLRFPTENGAYYLPVSTRSNNTPQGIKGPLALAHGSRNTVKAVFDTPEYIKDNKSELFIDLADVDSTLPVKDGSLIPSNKLKTFNHPYFDMDINGVYKDAERLLILDVTVHDKKDTFSTSGVTTFLDLIIEDPDGEEEEEEPEDDGIDLSTFANSEEYGYGASSRLDGKKGLSLNNERCLLALNEDSVVYDGSSRRGLFIYEFQDDLEENLLYIKTEDDRFDISPEMIKAVPKGYLEKYIEDETDSDFESQLDSALIYAKSRYEKLYPEQDKMQVSNMKMVSEPVEMPSICSYGEKIKESVKSTKDIAKLIKSLDVLDGNLDVKTSYYSSEAVLSQGFGSISDLERLALDLFKSLSIQTKIRTVTLTDRGKELISKYLEIDNSISSLPAISYLDENGDSKLMVIPFGLDLKDLDSFAYLESIGLDGIEENAISVEIKYLVEQTKQGHQAQIAEISDILGGLDEEGGALWVDGFSESISSVELSKEPIDIGFEESGGKLNAVVTAADKVYISETPLELRYYKVLGFKIIIDGKESYCAVDDKIDNLFFTVGIQMPELPEKAAAYVSSKLAKYKDAKPNTYDALRWRHQKIIYDFIASQTSFERELAKDLKLKVGRINNPYIILVKSEVKNGKIISSVDLLNVFNTIYNPLSGSEEEEFLKNKKIFKAISGIFATENEAKALVEGEGFFEIFGARPESSEVLLFSSQEAEEYRDNLLEIGLSEEILEYMINAGKMILIPTEPSLINNEKRWAWLEIDPKTYETIGVIDTFQHGALASNAVLNERLEKAQYVVGAFKGVETSVWAVSGFSLQTSDYKEIIKSAKKLALGIADSFGVSVGPVGFDIGGTLPGGKEIAKGMKDWAFGAPDKASDSGEDNKGFKEGYLDGVRAYFYIVENDL